MAFFLVTMVIEGPALKPLKTLNTFKITSIELPHRSIHYHVCSRGLHHNEVYLDERAPHTDKNKDGNCNCQSICLSLQ